MSANELHVATRIQHHYSSDQAWVMTVEGSFPVCYYWTGFAKRHVYCPKGYDDLFNILPIYVGMYVRHWPFQATHHSCITSDPRLQITFDSMPNVRSFIIDMSPLTPCNGNEIIQTIRWPTRPELRSALSACVPDVVCSLIHAYAEESPEHYIRFAIHIDKCIG